MTMLGYAANGVLDISTNDGNGSHEVECNDRNIKTILPIAIIGMSCRLPGDARGIPLGSIPSENVGVFIAYSVSNYALQLYRDTETIPTYMTTGVEPTMLANRISYCFNFKGPSMNIETACSSSITALHLACQSIRAGEISMAIVGGCHLNMLPDVPIAMSMIGLFSSDGKSYSFDERATSGFGRGEGASCLLIRALDGAIDADDPTRAVIRNTGVNQDGKTDGITMPSSAAQEALIRSTYSKAGINPQETQYVEAHVTGTTIGDPIEFEALGAVFGRPIGSTDTVYIGSVKSNIGHLEGVSGLPAIIKTTLMLERGMILPNCDFQRPRAIIPFSKWNFQVPTSMKYWPRNGTRRASISNFGFGGSNGHVILEEAHSYIATKKEVCQHNNLASNGRRRVFIMTGNDEFSVSVGTRKLAVYLQQRRESIFPNLLADLAHTLSTRRSVHTWRLATHAKSNAELAMKLQNPTHSPVRATETHRLGFLFTGQGAQWYAMGRELIASYPVFEASLTESDRILSTFGAHWSLKAELMRDAKSSQINKPYISQPACTALQIALMELLKSWEVLPTAVLGHSGGEIAAAYAAGALTAKDALAVAYYRGQSIERLRVTNPELKGSMTAVGLGETALNGLIQGLKYGKMMVIACINSPKSCTVSGDLTALSELERKLEDQGIFYRRLPLDMAYHSNHMAFIAGYYRGCLEDITALDNSSIHFYSALTGKEEPLSLMGGFYWVLNLLCPVQFAQALDSMIGSQAVKGEGSAKVDVLIEIGPHPALKGPIEQTLKSACLSSKVQYLPTLFRRKDAVETILDMLSVLISQGYRPNMDAVNLPLLETRKPTVLTNLPVYSWNRIKSYWSESRIAHQHRMTDSRHSILGTLVSTSSELEPVWRNIVRLEHVSWLRDHKLHSHVVYPMFGYISMAMQAGYQYATRSNLTVKSFTLREVSISEALILSEDSEVEMTTSLRPFSQGMRRTSEIWNEFVILSWKKLDGWREHCRGLISINELFVQPRLPRSSSAQEALQLFKDGKSYTNGARMSTWDPSYLYNTLEQIGTCYGPAFQGLEDIQVFLGYATANMRIPDAAGGFAVLLKDDPIIHPCTLDICGQIFFPNIMTWNPELNGSIIPTFMESMVVKIPSHKTSQTLLEIFSFSEETDSISSDVTSTYFVRDPENPGGAPLVQANGVKLAPISRFYGGSCVEEADKVCFKEVWNTYVDTIPMTRYQQIFNPPSIPGSSLASEHSNQILLAEKASLHFIDLTVKSLISDDALICAGRHGKLWNWMKQQRQSALDGTLAVKEVTLWTGDDPETTKQLFTFKSSGPFGVLVTKIGENLSDILRGNLEPLELMVEDGLLNQVYQDVDGPAGRLYPAAARFLELLVHESPP